MPSFDIVSKVDMQEIDNALHQAVKEIQNRYDFKGIKAELERKENELILLAQDESKLDAMIAVLHSKLVKRGIDLRSVDTDKKEPATGSTVRQFLKIKEGLDKESSKKITKAIKDMKLKVQPQIQEDMVRVTGKKIDDLQEVIANLKADEKVNLPLQFINMR